MPSAATTFLHFAQTHAQMRDDALDAGRAFIQTHLPALMKDFPDARRALRHMCRTHTALDNAYSEVVRQCRSLGTPLMHPLGLVLGEPERICDEVGGLVVQRVEDSEWLSNMRAIYTGTYPEFVQALTQLVVEGPWEERRDEQGNEAISLEGYQAVEALGAYFARVPDAIQAVPDATSSDAIQALYDAVQAMRAALGDDTTPNRPAHNTRDTEHGVVDLSTTASCMANTSNAGTGAG